MRRVSSFILGVGVFFAFAAGASADISWTLNNVDFYLGSWTSAGTVYTEVASLSGSFSTNNAVTAVTNFSNLEITAQPGYSSYAFPIAGMVDSYLPDTLGIYGAGWSNYIDLSLASPLTGSGGSVSMTSGYDCPGCAVLLPNSGAGVSNANLVQTASLTATPEPGFFAALAIGLAGLAFCIKRRAKA